MKKISYIFLALIISFTAVIPFSVSADILPLNNVMGETIQDGMPTSDNPVPLVSKSPIIDYTLSDGQTVSLDFSQYIDELRCLNGVVFDEVDYQNKQIIKRVGKLIINSGISPYNWKFYEHNATIDTAFLDYPINAYSSTLVDRQIMSTIALRGFYGSVGKIQMNFRTSDSQISLFVNEGVFISKDNLGVQQYITSIAPFEILYELAQPQYISFADNDVLNYNIDFIQNDGYQNKTFDNLLLNGLREFLGVSETATDIELLILIVVTIGTFFSFIYIVK